MSVPMGKSCIDRVIPVLRSLKSKCSCGLFWALIYLRIQTFYKQNDNQAYQCVSFCWAFIILLKIFFSKWVVNKWIFWNCLSTFCTKGEISTFDVFLMQISGCIYEWDLFRNYLVQLIYEYVHQYSDRFAKTNSIMREIVYLPDSLLYDKSP